MLRPVSSYALPSADLPVLVSIPHAGRDGPPWLLERARVPRADLLRLSDHWCDLIAAPLLERGATVVKANLLRAVADCNRHESDMDPCDTEPALRPQFGPPGRKARAGLGVVPMRLPGCGPLWRTLLDQRELEERLDLVHRPYHRALATAIGAMRSRFGQLLLIDVHSMPSLSATRGDPHPAGIIIGDRFGRSALPELSSILLRSGVPLGARLAINTPYAGGHVIESHGAPDRGVNAIQIEFDRQLYLDGDGRADADRAIVLGTWLTDAVAECLDHINGRNAVPLAAE